MKAGAQKHQLKMTAAGNPDSTLSKRADYVEMGKAKIIASISMRRGKKETWRTNNAGEMELDDEQHEEGWGRQKKR